MKDSDIILCEWFSEHWYKINKNPVEYYPSVTTKKSEKAQPFLAIWRGDIGNREADLRMNESSESGTRQHNAFWAIANGGVVIYQPSNR